MSENGKHIKSYTSLDIQKYLEGKLPASEMHAIEKAALDDPFLADAIEGFETISKQNTSVNIDTDINELHQKLVERIEERRKTLSPIFMFWRVAAAIITILVIGGITVTYILRNSKKMANIAQSIPKTITNDSTGANNTIRKPDSSKNTGAISQELTAKRAILKQREAEKKNFTAAQESDSLDFRVNKESIAQKDNTEEKNATAEITKSSEPAFHTDSIHAAPTSLAEADKALQGKVAGVDVSSPKYKKHFASAFEGKVVDANNKPVAGANIFTKKNKNAAVTDNNGFFQLKNENKNASMHVTVKSIGYQSESATLNINADSENIIHLQPATASLNEVVVVGYGVMKKTDLKKTDDQDEDLVTTDSLPHKAMPITGWSAFKTYIDRNKITTLDTAISGEEILSFLLDSTGKMSSFRVISSLSPAHYNEAVRLITNGPKWQLLKGTKSRIKISINF